MAFLQEAGSSVSQSVPLDPGTYSISFYAAERVAGVTQVRNYRDQLVKGFVLQDQELQVSVDSNPVLTVFPYTGGTDYLSYSDGYELESATFTVSTAGMHTIEIEGLDPAGGDNTAFINDVSLSVGSQLPDRSWLVSGIENFQVTAPSKGSGTITFTPPVGSAITINPSNPQATVPVDGYPLTATVTSVVATAGSPIVNLAATFTDGNAFIEADPAAVVFDETATVNWGDGTTTTGTVTEVSSGSLALSASHIYAEVPGRALGAAIDSVEPIGQLLDHRVARRQPGRGGHRSAVAIHGGFGLGRRRGRWTSTTTRPQPPPCALGFGRYGRELAGRIVRRPKRGSVLLQYYRPPSKRRSVRHNGVGAAKIGSGARSIVMGPDGSVYCMLDDGGYYRISATGYPDAVPAQRKGYRSPWQSAPAPATTCTR